MVVAGLLISNLALLAALAALVRLAATELDLSAAQHVPILVLVWPTTVFLSALYPESLFLLLAAAAFLAARRDRWREAGVAAALATLARPFGIVVAVGLLLEIVRRAPGRRARPLAWLSLAPLAVLAWWAYLTYVSGEPLAFFLTQTRFRRVPSHPFAAVGELFDPAKYGFPYFVGGLFLVTVVLVAYSWWKLRPALPAYATLVLAFLMGSGTLSSSMRYELAIFPILFVIASRGRRATLTYVVIATVICLMLGAVFSRQLWIG